MKKIQVFIVDDEISAINTLSGMLDQFCPQVKVLGHASTVGTAIEGIERLIPELILLDIEMPPFGNAFDLLRRLKHQKFGVIFTTAYPKYAIQAIREVQPWAYLVKPYSVQDLLDALNVADKKLQEINGSEFDETTTGIILPDARKGNIVVRFSEILYCRSGQATVDVFVRRNGQIDKITTYKTLRDLEGELPEHFFCRSHNSFLVNMSHIERFERTGRNGIIHLPDQIQVQISVQRMGDFEEKFQAFLHR
jgi:two-component system LytT family response regulator